MDYRHSLLLNQIYPIDKLTDYLDYGVTYHYFKGDCVEQIVRQPDVYVFILKGKVELIVRRYDGEETICAILEKGNGVGNFGHLIDSSSTKDMRCRTDVDVVVFPKKVLYKLMMNDEELLDEVMLGNMSLIELYHNRVLFNAFPSASMKIYALLKTLCDYELNDNKGKYNLQKGEHITLELNLSQKDLSKMLIIHTTTCNRLLKHLEEEGIIKINKSKIIVLDYEKLCFLLDNNVIPEY